MASLFKRMLRVPRSQSPVHIPEEIKAASSAAHLLLPSFNNVKGEEKPYEEFEKIVNGHPEFKHLMEQLIHMLDLRTYRLKLVVAKIFVRLWPQRSMDPNRGIQRSQEQLIEILKQPCAQVELQIFMKGLPEQLDKEEEVTAESNNGSSPTFTKDEAMNIVFQPIVELAVSGMDNVYSNELISNEEGIPQYVKSGRALEKYIVPPCGLRMRKQEYNALVTNDDRAAVNALIQKYSGGRKHLRKTKKSRGKKTRKLRRSSK
jgi:hypothetical protein